MMRASKGPQVFVTVVIFILVIIVIYMSQRNEMTRVRMPEGEARNDFALPTSEVKSNPIMAQTRLDVSKLFKPDLNQ